MEELWVTEAKSPSGGGDSWDQLLYNWLVRVGAKMGPSPWGWSGGISSNPPDVCHSSRFFSFTHQGLQPRLGYEEEKMTPHP